MRQHEQIGIPIGSDIQTPPADEWIEEAKYIPAAFAFNQVRTGPKVRLIAHNGSLYTDRSLITCPHLLAAIPEKRLMLLAETDRGRFSKPVSIDWPEFNAKMLRSALIEARKLRFIPPDVSSVTLPNGVEFSID